MLSTLRNRLGGPLRGAQAKEAGLGQPIISFCELFYISVSMIAWSNTYMLSAGAWKC
jgi:hypothetical protein